jgi:integrase
MLRVKPPKVVEQPVPVLSDEELAALIKACDGKRFVDRRDEAIVRLFIDTGMRLGELSWLTVDDIDLDLEVAVVIGKGRRLRSVPFGKSTTRAVDRYLRARRTHEQADQPWLWLGLKGQLSDSGIEQMIARRAEAAGLGRVNPHRFRHTFAHRWLAAGGTEGDLQRIAGWQSPQMLARYGASAADQRARDAHRRLGLGDQL